MKAFGAFVEHYILGIPMMFGAASLPYALLIWLALSKKDFVKATIWHRNSGFTIEAGRDRYAERASLDDKTD